MTSKVRVVCTPFSGFEGKRYGVDFREGRALVDADLTFHGEPVYLLLERHLGYQVLPDEQEGEPGSLSS